MKKGVLVCLIAILMMLCFSASAEYKEYEPQGDRYVWQATRQRHWFGPTKAEVSLVWLLGGSGRSKKGGDK